MSNRRIIFQFLSFALYIGVQVTIFRNLALFNVSFCFIYLGFILFLPIDIDRILLLFLGFISGLIIDLFYDSVGIHTAASVMLAFLRPHWINVLTPQGGFNIGVSPSLRHLPFLWITRYLIPIILIHHFAIFYIEAGGFSMFFFTLVKVLSSVLFTYFVLVLVQLLFYRR
jgi:hypothetical protein